MQSNSSNSIDWILLIEVAKITGQTANAIREYLKKGLLIQGTHWIKSRGRIYIHAARYNQWLVDSAV